MKRIKSSLFVLAALLLPQLVFAQATIKNLLGKIANLIINPLIVLGFAIATVFLFFSIAKLIYKADDSGSLKSNQESVKYGVIGLFIMFSVYGILTLVLKTFGIPCTGVFFFCS